MKAWRYLLEARERIDDEPRREWYDLKREIDREGWGPAAIRRFTAITCPYKNIELAVRLCEEVGDMHWFHISPIVPDDRPDISDFGRTHGLSGCVMQFASLFERLIELDVPKARQEFSAWPTDDDTAFSRIRLWAGGKPKLATPHTTTVKIRPTRQREIGHTNRPRP
jgi:hypothetical protein